MPTIDKPGIYVWGDPDQHWHITVAGDPSWPSPRKFQVILESEGTFTNRVVTGVAPVPVVTTGGGLTRLLWEGAISSGWVDLRFDLAGSIAMQLTLYLDTDGDGVARPTAEADRPKIVFLRSCRVNPPANPFILRPQRRDLEAGELLPGMDFLVGYCRYGTFPSTCYEVGTRISDLERAAGCTR
jgi:hypothetical protein